MNQPPENPFTSPGVDETFVVTPEAESARDDGFVVHRGLIQGNSPLSLPAVCLHCATDIEEGSGNRLFLSGAGWKFKRRFE